MDLIIIGLLGGLITGISPCILPVLPVIFLTGGAQSARYEDEVVPARRSRPYFVIAGLVLSFTLVTLGGSLLLGLLNLPQDIIRWVGIAVLIIIGVGLIVPRFQHILERPFQRFGQREVKNRGSGFGVGLALGAVFVPCAGPVLAAIIVAGSTGQIGVGTVLLTVSFSIGVAVPLLIFALAGRSVVERIRSFRSKERGLRIAAGIAMIALAVGLVFNVPQTLQRLLPDYTAPLQEQIADSDQVQDALDLGGLVNDENKDLDKCTNGAEQLESCGTAPSIKGIQEWLNTPNGEAIDLKDLRGQVVLIDFWAYSCINCQRSLPHVVAWDKAYRDAGLDVIGIHSPEYAFEKDPGNVAAGARDFGIDYPVALDNNLSTWTNYRNRYWPAHYLIDAEGTVRHISFGEGNYAATESMIRELLKDADPSVKLPAATDVEDDTPDVGSTTRETFLGSSKDVNYGGDGEYRKGTSTYALPKDQPADSFALDGDWKIETQFATPDGDKGRINLEYHAAEVRVVVAGSGDIVVRRDDGSTETIAIDGTPRSYELLKQGDIAEGALDIEVPAGVEVYSFTFG
ncbi:MULTISPECIES: cytochrome c biogenesis protein DipZ [unclassified Microbacterium]|uniref:cytochrome c biogenesis protein DipZ n=1 Tax=unclassified Microbacterium TaxID=2609290 RepID=UPI000CFD6A3A|nr:MULTISPECIES: cytochrome c biogenesis protein DipZ [unclassified Microbacterium]PQZ52838.1 thiol:disulfide interchange protein [Microbacterium sp. MYb43]PQZ74635.1 thiol:disulfide interchange protein [Microbacterium sp. MYb40]PRB19468.1 thiol:disulfide interchange protein [Microbacterium sp. MYb54]PRB24826.1 thiol:disulfide interchange protein [Microbacterium sp. MYb50]PRB62977.1 thiol:disulfide interchange protein [Microbacterium sp. MYb24]